MKLVYPLYPLGALLLGSALAAPTALPVSATGHGYDAPTRVQAGYVQLRFSNASKMPVDIGIFRLKPGVTDAQFRTVGAQVATNAAKDATDRLNHMVDALGGVGDVQPGNSDSATLYLTPGRYVLASLDADDTTHKTALSMGYFREINVRGPALKNAPAAADYRIRMVDYRFELPQGVRAGTHTWRVLNSGQEPHFALLARLLPGKTFKDAMASLMKNDQQGPPPVDFEHSVYAQVLTHGQSEDVSWNLSAGHYVVVCFVDNKQGVPHALMGMAQELVVR
ncbi:hypothetical protein [Deinococcus ruber]|uniref:Uncharacterized protein n=1 Tax=Deinococcus ruber TaxID=1848197 RepID=A0A918C4J5_9DEIO|nr:hypothetical protein [Deinococcus ruber]GGR06409.1 hypothetical protein GCM10008957_19010 [Deinococcus ruber]